ncbi:MAG TPA: hypothetical protein VHL11_17930 [Phototrophicaceae bacterium]|nr:hypothetical protein [Phototrophicaceae bacterium]
MGKTEIHDNGIKLQARYLPRGVYSYTYQARASTPGIFMVPPAIAYAAEQPDVFGRTVADSFIINQP